MLEVKYYLTKAGKNVVESWLEDLGDATTEARITARIARLATGNLGDCKSLRQGIWELRNNIGPGYRIYFSKTERTVILLLCAGDKRQQASDIDTAIAFAFLKDYRARTVKP